MWVVLWWWEAVVALAEKFVEVQRWCLRFPYRRRGREQSLGQEEEVGCFWRCWVYGIQLVICLPVLLCKLFQLHIWKELSMNMFLMAFENKHVGEEISTQPTLQFVSQLFLSILFLGFLSILIVLNNQFKAKVLK